MSIKPPRLIRDRCGVYYFRLIVPLALRDTIGKTELRRSLRTKETDIARHRALLLETTRQRAMKAHAVAMQRWRETCRELRQQDAKAWEVLRARCSLVPLAQRQQKAPHSQTLITPKSAPLGAKATKGPR